MQGNPHDTPEGPPESEEDTVPGTNPERQGPGGGSPGNEPEPNEPQPGETSPPPESLPGGDSEGTSPKK